jgi:hypothetical protein
MTRTAFLDAAQTAAVLLRAPALAERWTQPSALPGFTVGGLARHLANQVTHTIDYLATEPGDNAIPVLEHYTRNSWTVSGQDSPANRGILERGERDAALTNPKQLADDVDAALATLRETVPAQAAGRVVDFGEWGLLIDDFLLTRVMELVVHCDDVATSLDMPTPEMPAAATEATIDLLSRVAAWRHGPLAVVRALSREERAPASIAAL